jgi:hypothetical protein
MVAGTKGEYEYCPGILVLAIGVAIFIHRII